MVLPGRTACLACIKAAAEVSTSGTNDRAALPATSAVLAGLLVNQALKHLLDFDTPVGCSSYNATQGTVALQAMDLNTTCPESQCQKLQQTYR
jgi:ubiquitin-like modifier-activating enzyme 5